MDAQTAQPPATSGPSSSSSAYPRWVMLEKYRIRIRDDSSSISTAADKAAATMASARTSTGHVIRFSLRVVQAPLATPTVRIQQVPGGGGQRHDDYAVVAAHGDSLLVRVEQKLYRPVMTELCDYFVYNAGDAAAARPPALWLLPPCCLSEEGERKPVRHRLLYQNLGLVRRDDGEIVVAELRTPMPVPELVLFRSSTGKWTVKRVLVSYSAADFAADDGQDQEFWEHLPWIWSTVVPVGDHRLCWVHLSRGVMVICDGVFDETPRLRYLKLPMDPYLSLGLPSNQNRNVCATASGDTLKFVNVFPRCCCGSAGAAGCERSRHAYTVHTWTLRIVGGGGDMDDEMEWVKDGMIDCTELWGLEKYKGLPRVPLDHPVVSLDEDEPHVVYFQLSESHHVKHMHDGLVWLVKVDVRSKTIRSVSRYEDGFPYIGVIPIPSNVSYFFNSSHRRPPPRDDDGTVTAQGRQMAIERRRPVVVGDEQTVLGEDDDARKKPMLEPSSSLSSSDEKASEFLETFLEISRYGFDGDDQLKAYKILSQDNGRRFRSLLKLPKDSRKDWLLLEIKQG